MAYNLFYIYDTCRHARLKNVGRKKKSVDVANKLMSKNLCSYRNDVIIVNLVMRLIGLRRRNAYSIVLYNFENRLLPLSCLIF